MFSSSTLISLGLVLSSLIALSLAVDPVQIEVLHKPDTCERKSENKNSLTMHYTGTLEKDGKVFDSSHNRGQPFTFQIGVGHVIKGWEEGLLDMCEGEKRKLTIQPSHGYGDQGAGEVIPPGATLIFETELLKIEDGPAMQNVFKQIDEDGDDHLSREEVMVYIKKQLPTEGETQEGQEAQDPQKITEEIFQHEDKDRDGFISKEEFSGPKHDEL